MSSQNPPNQAHLLTFGIEFEFMVAILTGGPDPHPHNRKWTIPVGMPEISNEDEAEMGLQAQGSFASQLKTIRAQEYVVSLLKMDRIPALSDFRFFNVGSEDEGSDWGDIDYVRDEADEQGVLIDPNHVATHNFWVVSNDVGIEIIEREDIDGYEFEGVEVASRILPETHFNEVERVYSLIQSCMRTHINSSCGLHIHVGINHLSVESTKKLVTLLWILEQKGLFEKICAPHRASSNWCQPVSQYSRAVMMCSEDHAQTLPNMSLLYHVPQLYGMAGTLRRGLTRIWNCDTIDKIAKETKTFKGTYGYDADDTYSRRGGFALRNITWGLGIQDNVVLGDLTIEFRYKESTGSASQDHHWLKLCLGFVRGAEWPVERFRNVVWELYAANTLKSCLVSLGMEDNEVQWWLERAQHHRDHPRPARRTQFLEPENLSNYATA